MIYNWSRIQIKQHTLVIECLKKAATQKPK